MKKVALYLIIFYQKVLSLDTGILKKIGVSKGYVCMHYPTCSEYTKQAIQKYGLKKGFSMGLKRISRCRPGNSPQVDPLV